MDSRLVEPPRLPRTRSPPTPSGPGHGSRSCHHPELEGRRLFLKCFFSINSAVVNKACLVMKLFCSGFVVISVEQYGQAPLYMGMATTT